MAFKIQAQQCPGEYYLFYSTPINSLDSANWNKVDLSFFNQSDKAKYSIEFRYRSKEPNSELSERYQVYFTELNQQVDFTLDGLDHNQKYELFVCDKFIGEFQDARELLEIYEDFEYQKNRLYYVPFYAVNAFYYNNNGGWDYNKLSGLTKENGNTSLKFPIYKDHSIPIQSMDFLAARKNIPFKISLNFLINSYILLGHVGVGEHGKAYYVSAQFENGTIEDQWGLLYSNITNEDYSIQPFDGNDNIHLPIWLFSNPVSQIYPAEHYLDNIKIQVDGDRIEICSGDQVNIYGQMQSKEGIYLDTIYNSSGLLDSIIYTTLMHHPPLFIDRISNDHFRSTGEWLNYNWYDCSSNSLIGSGKDFYPSNNGSFYLVTYDDVNCTDTTECIGLNNLSTNEIGNGLIEIYPNPVDDLLTITLDQVSVQRIKLFDMWGRKLLSLEGQSGKEQYIIDMTAFPDGVYFIEILSDNQVLKSERVVKR